MKRRLWGMKPLVSAIVSSYNAERFMRGLLQDLERQTIADRLEIVIVDSNSPQNEGAIIREFQERYENIVYLRTEERENSHVSFNRCIQMARGKYVTLANTDDRHRPDALQKMAETLEARPEVALVYSDMAITRLENDTWESGGPREYCLWPDFDPQLLFQICYLGPQPMWRREVHERHGFFDPGFWSAGDYEFWLRLARKEKFLHLPEVLGLYFLSPQGNELKDKGLSIRESERARERYWPSGWGKRPLPFNRNPFVVRDLSEESRRGQAEVLKQQGAFFFSRGDLLGAEKAFRLALGKNPEDPAGLVSLGKICLDRQHFRNALTLLQKATRLDPENRDAWTGLALAAQRMNKKALAKEAHRQACRLTSSPPSAHPTCPAPIEEERIAAEEGRAMGRRADSLPPEKPPDLPSPKDLNDIGEELCRRGKIEVAPVQTPEARIEGTKTMGEEYAVAARSRGEAEREAFRDYQKIQNLISQGKDEEALEALEEFLRPSPVHSAAHDDLGVLYFRKGDRGRAAAQFLKSIEADPKNHNAMKNLADLSAEMGQWEEAFHLYQRILEEKPDDPEALRGVARVCGEKGLGEDAEFFFRRFQEVKSRRLSSPIPPGEAEGCGVNSVPQRGAAGEEEPPGSSPVSREAWLWKGERLFEEGKLEEARRIFEGVLTAHPSNAQALNNLGVMALLEEKSDRATTYFSRALEMDPQNIDAQANMAQSLVAQGLYEEAIPWLEKILRSNPQDPSLWNSLGSCFLQLGDENKAEEMFAHSHRLDRNQEGLPEILRELRGTRESSSL